MNDCEHIIGQLQAYLQPGGAARIPLADLLQHLVVCTRCQNAAHALVAALRLDEDDRLTCVDVETLLPQYSIADPAGSEWAAIRLHLALCPHCVATYLELCELEQLAEQDSDPITRPVGKPRLDFLPHRRTAATPAWWIDELGRLIVAFSRDLLTTMLAAPPAPPAFAVKTTPHARPLGRLTIDSASEHFAVMVAIDERADDPASCILLVEVRVPSRGGWPHLAGSEVRVAVPGREDLVRLTDAFGRVTISPLSREEIATLTLTVVPVA